MNGLHAQQMSHTGPARFSKKIGLKITQNAEFSRAHIQLYLHQKTSLSSPKRALS
jgi:hypothetical protein